MNDINLFNSVSLDCSKNITKRYSTSFSIAIKVLHPDLQGPIHSIYGFVRLADEIVDTFHQYDKQDLLLKFKEETFQSIAGGISLNPALHSFQRVVNTYQIDHELIHAFFDSMFADLEKKDWVNSAELEEYIYGSAEVVGLMCLQVFCEGDTAKAAHLSPAASALGAAFQKINFLRDLKDDLYNLGRSYFGKVDLQHFDHDTKKAIEEDIHQDFLDAYKGIVQLPAKARFGVFLAYRYYLCLFNKIKKLPPEIVLQKRIRVHNVQKALLYLQVSLTSKWQLD